MSNEKERRQFTLDKLLLATQIKKITKYKKKKTQITNNFVVCTNSSGNRLSFARKNLQRNVMEQKGLQTRKSSSRVFDFSIYFKTLLNISINSSIKFY